MPLPQQQRQLVGRFILNRIQLLQRQAGGVRFVPLISRLAFTED